MSKYLVAFEIQGDSLFDEDLFDLLRLPLQGALQGSIKPSGWKTGRDKDFTLAVTTKKHLSKKQVADRVAKTIRTFISRHGRGVSPVTGTTYREYLTEGSGTQIEVSDSIQGKGPKRHVNPDAFEEFATEKPLWKLVQGEWKLATSNKDLNKSVNALKPPRETFGIDGANVFRWELQQPRYVKEAAAWAKHYQQEYRRFTKDDREWEEEFGEKSYSHGLAASGAFWLWLAWELVARRHGSREKNPRTNTAHGRALRARKARTRKAAQPQSSVAPFGTKWNGEKAKQRLRQFTADMSRAQTQAVFEKAFAMWPKRGETRSNLDNYKLPVMDVKRGKLVVVPKAVASAKGYLHGARGVKMEATAAQKRDAERRLKALDLRVWK